MDSLHYCTGCNIETASHTFRTMTIRIRKLEIKIQMLVVYN